MIEVSSKPALAHDVHNEACWCRPALIPIHRDGYKEAWLIMHRAFEN